MKLYPYQADDLARIERHLATDRRVLYVLPTGGGKTVVAAAVMHARWKDRQRVVFVVHRRELVTQAVERLAEAGIPSEQIGVVMAGDARVRSIAPIQVASLDTMRSRIARGYMPVPACDLVVADEAHRTAAPTYHRLLDAIDAPLLGLTATPTRLNGGGLSKVFATLVVGAQPSELIDSGHIMRGRVWTVPDELLPDLRGVRTVAGDFEQRGLARAANRPVLVGSAVEHYQRLASDRRAVVFSVDVEHSRSLCAAFVAAGVRAEHLDGGTPLAERKAILGRVRSGDTRVISNCGVLVEGWDLPELSCAIIARPTRSLALWLQMVGRAVRAVDGKPDPIILDHAGNAIRLGMPQADREWTLTPRRRNKSANAPQAKRCPECGEVRALTQAVCECGYEWPTRHKATKPGSLVERLKWSDKCVGCGRTVGAVQLKKYDTGHQICEACEKRANAKTCKVCGKPVRTERETCYGCTRSPAATARSSARLRIAAAREVPCDGCGRSLSDSNIARRSRNPRPWYCHACNGKMTGHKRRGPRGANTKADLEWSKRLGILLSEPR